jgi:glycine/D-amino acid oxidase-like deaminating enzyme
MTVAADVVVIGAGVVGAACAHRLSRTGLRVVVLDRGEPNGGGSGATAANIHVQGLHSRRPDQAVHMDVRRLLPLQQAARQRWDAVADELGRDVGFVPSGGLMIAETPDQAEALRAKQAWEAAAGIDTEVLDGDAARDALPLLGPGVSAATWCAADAFADPWLTTPAYLAAARETGASVHPHHAVRELHRNGQTWRVAAGPGTWEAPFVVNAAGPWLGEIAALAGAELVMAPLAIQMHRLAPTEIRLPHLVQHVGEGFSVKQDPQGRPVLGGGWPAAPWTPGAPPIANPVSTAGNLAQLHRLLPALGNVPVTSVHPGPLAATPDEMPVVGVHAEHPGLLSVGGTYAFTLAPLWADTVAALVTGTPPPVDIADLGPNRLRTPTTDLVRR